ncbi:hypothetical protein [Methylopila sp. Yamaguchi]|uniref:hypothetical protein n=1 Tax=Methylopila sp. Yamaguchi TaxID=1437817 RepID=UPI0013586DA8|nr:hypothetical protein [Methylopila sp. Yamaguchi]
MTVQEAARQLGIQHYALRRAVKAGVVPAFAPFNSRKLVRLSEVVGVIRAAQV